ncbi:MAG TPA: gamma-glutamyltransferase [Actinobacteria bacterium]|nr:gamma-glutamyltransferase [Actinomycetota bacterium]
MRRTLIAAPTELAAHAGARIADEGGNAVDAAIAATVTAMCTEPGIIAPGASGFLAIWPPTGEPLVVDAYAEMPGREAPRDRFGSGAWRVHMDYGGGMETMVGWGAVATPGAFAGFDLAWRRFGEAPWRLLLEPAVEAVRTGFPVSESAANYLGYAHRVIFGWHPESRRLLHRADGRPVAAGDRLRIPELAATLERLAHEGAETLYRGELARALAAAVDEGGGLLGRADLEAYEPVVRTPTRFRLDDWEVATNPPPAVGGVALAAMLLLLGDRFEGWTAAGVRRAVEAFAAVGEYRRVRLSDPDDRVRAAEELLRLAAGGDLPGIRRSAATIHTSAVDSDGLACSITVSAGYGSGAVVPGTGFALNNSLGELELAERGFHGLRPGTRLVSNMAPTVARGEDGSVLAVGSPGADRITTALATVLLGFVHLGLSLTEAVHHPRLHVERFEGRPTIAYEPGLPVEPFDGYSVRRFPDRSMYFGGVQAALWHPATGFFGVADPRRAGATATGGVD